VLYDAREMAEMQELKKSNVTKSKCEDKPAFSSQKPSNCLITAKKPLNRDS